VRLLYEDCECKQSRCKEKEKLSTYLLAFVISLSYLLPVQRLGARERLTRKIPAEERKARMGEIKGS